MKHKYRVTWEFRGKVSVEIEAANPIEAEQLSKDEAYEEIGNNLNVYEVKIRVLEIRKSSGRIHPTQMNPTPPESSKLDE